MSTNTPNMPTPPTRRKKKSSNHLIGVVSGIAVASVILSGVAAYGGYTLAAKNNSTANSSVNSFVPGYSHNVSEGNTIQVLDVSDVVATLRPSVVEIGTESVTTSFFGQGIAAGAGSGVILSDDGYIVTNNHVIDGAQKITVTTYDGQTYEASLVGTDPQTDVAVIKCADASGLVPAVLGNSDEIKVGEAVIAIGNPLGSLGGTVTTGIISAVGREITIANETMTLLQTDAAINSGNSGGGLFDINGQLIGIVNAKQAAEGIEGLGFAIPISDVTSVIQDLMNNGKVTTRPLLGVSLQDIPEGANTQNKPGVYVVQITKGGSADTAGLEFGDRIVSFDGTDTMTAAEVKKVLRSHAIGDQVEMIVERNGENVTLTIELQGSGQSS